MARSDNEPEGFGHRYLPTGDVDRAEMLEAIGIPSVDELFGSLPESVRLRQPPDVLGPLSDQELRGKFSELERANQVAGRDLVSFLGAGAYRHDTPSAMDHLIQRAEFLTVYTPYQPEMSQGTLQAIFEYQTFISELTGLPVANASLYDGATAFTEAILMAYRVQRKRKKIVVSRGVHPQYRETLRTYLQNLDLEVVEVGWDEQGLTDLGAVEAALDDNTICVAVQSPNYFGGVESWERTAKTVKAVGALLVGVVTEALSMALLKSPGDAGCDLAVGEAQSFGLPVAYGGPYLGFLACKEEMKRAMPGRLVGQTVDSDGERAFVLTLATREQHIRREKATSNICTNQSLCALAATIYLALLGRQGLRRLAELNLRRAAALRRRITDTSCGVTPRFDSVSFNEFAVAGNGSGVELLSALEKEGILGGVPLGPDYPELEDSFLVAVTECNPPSDLDAFVEALARLEGGQL